MIQDGLMKGKVKGAQKGHKKGSVQFSMFFARHLKKTLTRSLRLEYPKSVVSTIDQVITLSCVFDPNFTCHEATLPKSHNQSNHEKHEKLDL